MTGNIAQNIAQNIAMWSGPRNISTAMMYAFAARGDCQVWDEPFYAWYLKITGLDHPLRGKIIAAGITNADEIITLCTEPRSKLHYQKHMTQHMLKNLDRSWITDVNNAFLIRSPEQVLASYNQKRQQVSLADIGYAQQLEIFNQVADHTGTAPPVIDSDKFLQDPQTGLQNLCTVLNIPFSKSMLSWPAGPKSYDGIWAKHWYNAAHQSTGFASPAPKQIILPEGLQKIADQARPIYEKLRQFAL